MHLALPDHSTTAKSEVIFDLKISGFFYMEKVLTVPSVESKGSQHVMLERKQEALILSSDDVFLK